jgi:hypothetical protein
MQSGPLPFEILPGKNKIRVIDDLGGENYDLDRKEATKLLLELIRAANYAFHDSLDILVLSINTGSGLQRADIKEV